VLVHVSAARLVTSSAAREHLHGYAASCTAADQGDRKHTAPYLLHACHTHYGSFERMLSVGLYLSVCWQHALTSTTSNNSFCAGLVLVIYPHPLAYM
jgi:hypothetical protein